MTKGVWEITQSRYRQIKNKFANDKGILRIMRESKWNTNTKPGPTKRSGPVAYRKRTFDTKKYQNRRNLKYLHERLKNNLNASLKSVLSIYATPIKVSMKKFKEMRYDPNNPEPWKRKFRYTQKEYNKLFNNYLNTIQNPKKPNSPIVIRQTQSPNVINLRGYRVVGPFANTTAKNFIGPIRKNNSNKIHYMIGTKYKYYPYRGTIRVDGKNRNVEKFILPML